MSTKYAILAQTTRLQYKPPTCELENQTTDKQNFTVAAGTLVKVAGEQQTSLAATQVYVYDAVLREPNTTRIYECAPESLLPVSDNLWPFIVSIPEPNRRLQLLKDTDRCNWLNHIMPGDVISVPGRSFDRDDIIRYDCIVCYIGPVPEIHPVGYFFGLELMDDITSPQAADVPFTKKYFECEDENALFITADRIIPTPPFQNEDSSPENGTEANEANGNEWSFTAFIFNTVESIRASLPI
ncbi:uncharacterized protein LOC101454997 [Ceratitis capitata]|uniref:uncharacterized protein LOC101454997 n=1 Tax=Ceratitis capitata TaxID=7213 RepID=UPI0003297083|nr:uncharacterized protein LOC101454997 [Ceratitis capitata]